MRFSTFLLPALATFALAAPSAEPQPAAAAAKKPENSAKIVTDINTLSTQLSALNSTLNTFKPLGVLNVVTALKIRQQTKDLQTTLDTAVADARASRKFTSDGSGNVALVVVNLLDPINSTLTNLVAHKPAFASAVLLVGDISKTVEQALQDQRASSAALGAVLTKKLADPYNLFAPQITGEITGMFDTAIAKFKSCSGILCLPPIGK